MRSTSFVLTFAFVMIGPSLAGPTDHALPGIGTFSYSGSPVVAVTPRVVAAN
jgi:hypothetical protein